jgi:hypothetical protein
MTLSRAMPTFRGIESDTILRNEESIDHVDCDGRSDLRPAVSL